MAPQVQNKPAPGEIELRTPDIEDLEALVGLENKSFTTDKLSRRSFRHWLTNAKCNFLVAERDGQLLGYGLVLLQQGTRLARLYSLAVDPAARGLGLGERMLLQLEELAVESKRLFMRLEVEEGNRRAIDLYEKLGYKQFGEIPDYYENHSRALRMQKCIRRINAAQISHPCLWYQQTTDFTCGPAALLMSIASQSPGFKPSQEQELDIWRQATTIFMTTGHGGCHPIGLALAAQDMGFEAEVVVNNEAPLFLDGVRSQDKKKIVSLVDRQFRDKAQSRQIPVKIEQLELQHIRSWLAGGYTVMVLISTYRFEGRKAPHWVMVTGMDELCMYVHDSDIGEHMQDALDCQHVPIALADFSKMASYGANKMRTAVAIRRR
ncbi:GNAT family N-acetyltransferase/peptidase C39 family protein [Pseudomaricurvus alcaniphilus]|uniref:GNAT family N-acetyltransferase/peptidase C39 family protein n=1 Tax=Pseudomaricurvus alcaniphilus TaxID=1166482 RepID=UPI001A9F7082|nr:GNAT family N-acetyltransferase/peptidase C39 family protein [Pseudomaricurvus alcaniphilus]